jgi:hypothetical protein
VKLGVRANIKDHACASVSLEDQILTVATVDRRDVEEFESYPIDAAVGSASRQDGLI